MGYNRYIIIHYLHQKDCITIKFGDKRSVGTLSKLNRAFTVPHVQVYRTKFGTVLNQCVNLDIELSSLLRMLSPH